MSDFLKTPKKGALSRASSFGSAPRGLVPARDPGLLSGRPPVARISERSYARLGHASPEGNIHIHSRCQGDKGARRVKKRSLKEIQMERLRELDRKIRETEPVSPAPAPVLDEPAAAVVEPVVAPAPVAPVKEADGSAKAFPDQQGRRVAPAVKKLRFENPAVVASAVDEPVAAVVEPLVAPAPPLRFAHGDPSHYCPQMRFGHYTRAISLGGKANAAGEYVQKAGAQLRERGELYDCGSSVYVDMNGEIERGYEEELAANLPKVGYPG